MLVQLHGEDKKMFIIKFAKRMLKWNPEERSTAKELLQDPWLYAEFDGDRSLREVEYHGDIFSDHI